MRKAKKSDSVEMRRKFMLVESTAEEVGSWGVICTEGSAKRGGDECENISPLAGKLEVAMTTTDTTTYTGSRPRC